MALKSTDLRPGMAVKMDSNIFVITQFQHVTPGNLRAFIQVKLKRVPDGQILDRRLRSGEDVEVIDLDRRDFEYIYSDNTGYVFMDTETYDQMAISAELLGNAVNFLIPNLRVNLLIAEGLPLAVELPKTVDLKVEDTPPGIKAATATNQLKEAKLETGYTTRVPGFINIGEVIRVNTETGEYLSRA